MNELEQLAKHLESVETKQDVFQIMDMIFVIWQN